MENYGNFSSNLKTARKARKMTQKQLATLIGYSQKTIASYEQGASEPDIRSINLMSEILGVSNDYLLGKLNPLIYPYKKAGTSLSNVNLLSPLNLVPVLKNIHRVDGEIYGKLIQYVIDPANSDVSFATYFSDDAFAPQFVRGDIALVRRVDLNQIKNGDYVCVSNQTYSFIRQYQIDETGEVELLSANNKFKPVDFKEPFIILGIVSQCMTAIDK